MIVTGSNCIFARSTLSVRLNMDQPNNDHALSATQDARPRYTGKRLLRERPKIYRQIVRLLGEMVSEQNLQMVSCHERNRPRCRTTRSHGDKRAKKDSRCAAGECR